MLPALPNTNAGTVAAGIQNFIICLEMFFAAIALRYAFPYLLYAVGVHTGTCGRDGGDGGGGGDYESLVDEKGRLSKVWKNDVVGVGTNGGRPNGLRSLRDTFNPRDMLHDAIHNFHPTYQKYMEQRSHKTFDDDDDSEGTVTLHSIPPPPVPPVPGRPPAEAGEAGNQASDETSAAASSSKKEAPNRLLT
ncbi:unnamed protein product [Schistocephalus solidus]|uniref:Transmembrane protein n=1 Tax=Schistocephalus solidus TaxID=70667 RepID=A0A183T4L0_SCHSO|nr:unnamed protein product [Schistocephalus solidus]